MPMKTQERFGSIAAAHCATTQILGKSPKRSCQQDSTGRMAKTSLSY
jgi:hypothetical protein